MATTELGPPMSAYRLDMSFSTPILTVFSWANAGAASPNPAHAISAAARRASVVFINFLQMLTPGSLSLRSLTKHLPRTCQGLAKDFVDQHTLVPITPSVPPPHCAYRS